MTKQHKYPFGGERYTHYLDCGIYISQVCMYNKIFKLYTFNMCCLLYTNYSSIKLFFFKGLVCSESYLNTINHMTRQRIYSGAGKATPAHPSPAPGAVGSEVWQISARQVA